MDTISTPQNHRSGTIISKPGPGAPALEDTIAIMLVPVCG